MQRDIDLIRKLLLEIEKAPPDHYISGHEISTPNYTIDQVLYHLVLLEEANMINAQCIYGDDKIQAIMIQRITWSGHDFLDAIRDDTVWGKTRDKIGNFGSASIEVIKQVAVKILADLLSQSFHP